MHLQICKAVARNGKHLEELYWLEMMQNIAVHDIQVGKQRRNSFCQSFETIFKNLLSNLEIESPDMKFSR